MPTITFEGADYVSRPGESVLDCLERHGVAMASSCRSGVCQSCMMRLREGAAPEASVKGLKPALRSQGYFLSCVCHPATDLEVMRADGAVARVSGTIEHIAALNGSVALLRVRPDAPFEYVSGQFVNLVRPGGALRSYSLASVPTLEPHLDFHIALMPGGLMSAWVHHEARPGDVLEVQGPHGQCFYVPGQPEQPMLLLGTGTGLAPLYGIVRDALCQGHTGAIHLFHGSLSEDGLYLMDELHALSHAHPQFRYYPCALRGEQNGRGIHIGAVDAYAMETAPALKGWRVYLCGHPDMVKLMQRKVFLAGADLKNIHADAFLASAAKAS